MLQNILQTQNLINSFNKRMSKAGVPSLHPMNEKVEPMKPSRNVHSRHVVDTQHS